MMLVNARRHAPLACALAIAYASDVQAAPTVPVEVPTRGKTVETFVADFYRILARKDADLNGDGLVDTAIVSELDDDALRFERPRPLLMLFRERGGSYTLSGRSDSVVETAPPGVHGDRFESIEIRTRSIVVTDAGVSGAGATGDRQVQRLRYQNGGWYLIGRDRTNWSYIDQPVEQLELDRANRYMCPQLTLAAREYCAQHQTSANFNTAVVVDTWKIPDAGKPQDAPMRTREARRALAPPVWAPLSVEP